MKLELRVKYGCYVNHTASTDWEFADLTDDELLFKIMKLVRSKIINCGLEKLPKNWSHLNKFTLVKLKDNEERTGLKVVQKDYEAGSIHVFLKFNDKMVFNQKLPVYNIMNVIFEKVMNVYYETVIQKVEEEIGSIFGIKKLSIKLQNYDLVWSDKHNFDE